MVAEQLKLKVNVDHREPARGLTLLHIAAGSGYVDSVQLLLSSGAQRDLGDHQGQLPMHHGAGSGSAQVIECLLYDRRARATINRQDKDGRTPLHHAAYSGVQAVVDRLLEVGADTDLEDKEGFLPLSDVRDGHHLQRRMAYGLRVQDDDSVAKY